MTMGTITSREFEIDGGRKVILRPPRWDDLDDLLQLINSLVEEEADIIIDQMSTREEESEWLTRHLIEIAKGTTIGLVAEVQGKVVANSEVTKGTGRQRHVGFFGIIIARDYRGKGIGTNMMRALIDESTKAGLRILVLDVYASNTRARNLYRKMGFRESGTIPRMISKRDDYVDCIRMYRDL